MSRQQFGHSSEHTITHKTQSSSDTAEGVYQEQVRLLYRQLPFSLITTSLITPVFIFVIWEATIPVYAISWLILQLAMAGIRYLSALTFFAGDSQDINFHKWEKYFIVGVTGSALLWGSTSLWIQAESPITQQLFQIFIISALTGGAAASLPSRPLVFRIYLILILLPYIVNFIAIGTNTSILIGILFITYVVLIIPTSNKIYNIITDSLQTKIRNTELLEYYKEADEYNKKANEAMFEIMQKNKTKELELKKSEIFLRSIFRTANDGILTTDSKGKILAINHAIERDFGYSEAELIGKSVNIIMAEEMGARHDQYMQQYLHSDAPVLIGRMLDVTGRKKDGSLFPIEITVSETRVDNKIYFTGFIRNISERREYENALNAMMKELAQAKQDLEHANLQLQDHNKALTRLSEHDALTGLANRRYLMNNLRREWFRHRRSNKPISIILLDIDYFKKFNDNYGHPAGDACLKKIAAELQKNISRSTDFIARYGGEEFIVVLPETEINGAFHLAEKMREAVENLKIEHRFSDMYNWITISGGAADIYPDKENNCEQLIQMADEALYDAKHSGRNCIQKYIGNIKPGSGLDD